MISITSILCLYGYYKCRRRRFRQFTERQTLKFKQDFSSYNWLGQQPSISSSPYLIQSTSIWLSLFIICLELYIEIIVKDFIPKVARYVYVVYNQSNGTDVLGVHIYTLRVYMYVESITIICRFFSFVCRTELNC